ncbi:histone family protein nucleoid-structuring protein H-NS [mine drainage metagenome]|uniref:Histone family protein nucleoid-structuring protein H-NS n=1 Tax=mine drainage metagenome TaxID=410659 RepID=T1BTP1_9ZZZZ
MAKLSMKNYSLAQVNELMRQAATRKAELEQSKLVELRDHINALLKKNDVTLEQVFHVPARRAAAVTRHKRAPAKYCDPTNRSVTWSGHGKRPRWFLAALKSGKKPEDLLVK